MKTIFFVLSLVALLLISVNAQSQRMNSQKRMKQEKADEQPYKTAIKEFTEQMKKQMPPEAWEKGERVGKEAVDEMNAKGASKKAIGVGAEMPSFSLKDAFGQTVNSADLLAKGPVVIVFYRGSWCPYCNVYLRTIQKYLTQIQARGATLIGITPEIPGKAMEYEKKNLKFAALSDPQLSLSQKLGLAYEVPTNLDNYYKGIGKDVAKEYGLDKPELLMSAVYIADRKGKVAYVFTDVSPKSWPEPGEVIAALDKLK